ncbi:MAG TPA: hypothetical protein P5531_00530 [Bacteroidales bacterium]|nr:hypothetical protein [Bacteroidales bacterium]HSA42143.1 hypothetical protein [Bacteroidales bacterium]
MGLGGSWMEKIMIIFGFVMVALYLVIGAILMFFRVFDYVPKEIRVIFGFFFTMYGVFRLVRLIQKVNELND